MLRQGAGRAIPLIMRSAQRRELAVKAVAIKGVSIALACRAFEVSETCYRYSPKLDDENEQIADLLLGLTKAKKTCGFGLCFLYLRCVRADCASLFHPGEPSWAAEICTASSLPLVGNMNFPASSRLV